MAKSNKSKPIQLLSPENYIRQKARNLPIYECKVNASWEEERMAEVLIARNHANGNITLCFYLVDLGCLGVKDSFFNFNITLDQYAELLDKFEGELPLEDISYTLAHNIIYAGVQYAEEFGFKPHKDYTSVTRFMLEDDTDDIELIEIEMGGKDGQPLYVNSGFDSEARVKQIIAQLEKTAGVGNFNYVLQVGGEEFDEDNDDEFSVLMLEELKEEFLALMDKGMDNLSQVETVRIIKLSNEIYAEICNENKVYDYIDEWEKELEFEITDEYTNEFIGVDKNVTVTTKQLDLIDEILSLFGENDKKAQKKIIELEKQIGKTSLIAIMELELLKGISMKDFENKLADYSVAYPDCSLIKIMNHLETFKTKKDTKLNEYLPDSDFIFEGRNSVTGYEMSRYLTDKLFLIAGLNDVNLIQAFFLFLDDVDLEEEAIEDLQGITGILKISILRINLENQSTKPS